MKILLPACFLFAALLSSQSSASAQDLDFSLQGSAGPGILAANEPAEVIDGGTGDVGPAGIQVDLVSGLLSLDIEWGSGNGYVDLSSDVELMNLHGPTSAVAPDNFMESAGALIGLEGFDPSASSGGFVGQVTLSIGDVRRLLEGRLYVHLHTQTNSGGEARGYLIPDVVVGDVNHDGMINLLDVSQFVAALSGGPFVDEADINRDGFVNLLDINPFIALLSG